MTIEVTAKKVEDAIKQGLEQLGATLDEVTVEVVESGGFLRKAKVRLTLEREEAKEPEPDKKPEKVQKPDKPEKIEKVEKPVNSDKADKPEKAKAPKPEKTVEKVDKVDKADKPEKAEKVDKPVKKTTEQKAPKKSEKPEVAENAEKAEKAPKHTKEEEKQALNQACEFVKTVVGKMGFEATVALNEESGMIAIDAPAGDDALLIGRHGETLSALSYLAETAQRAEKYRIGVTVDCNGYRGRRADNLMKMAHRRADECVRKHRKIKLESMDRIDRRTVHCALADDDRVTTASEGKEPHRYIVICPKKN